MLKHYILDAHGEVQEVEDPMVWAQWFERASRDRSRIVAQDLDESDPARTIKVSTVFLGLDHNFGEGGPPILWETMVFGGPLDQFMRRYHSREAALAGHQQTCADVKKALRKLLPFKSLTT